LQQIVAFTVFIIHFRHSVVRITTQGFPTSLKLKAAFTSGTLVCPNYKSELRHIPQDCNYITFTNVNIWNLRILYFRWPHFKTAHNNAKQDAKQKVMDRLHIVKVPISYTKVCILLKIISCVWGFNTYICIGMHHFIKHALQFFILPVTQR